MGLSPNCSICISSSDDFTAFAACPCGHAFHYACILEWVESCRSQYRSPACPTCNADFDDVPAKGIVKKLFFSFDGDESAESRPKAPTIMVQMPKSVYQTILKFNSEKARLSSLVAERDAEIDFLKGGLLTDRDAEIGFLRSSLDAATEQIRQADLENIRNSLESLQLSNKLFGAQNAASCAKGRAEELVSSLERRCEELTRDISLKTTDLTRELKESRDQDESFAKKRARVDCFQWQIAGMEVQLRDSHADLRKMNELLRVMETPRPAAATYDDHPYNEPVQICVSNISKDVKEDQVWVRWK